MDAIKTEFRNVRCELDDIDMVQQVVEVSYLTHKYPVEMMACPKCGQVFIPEDLVDKMREVEATLEEK